MVGQGTFINAIFIFYYMLNVMYICRHKYIRMSVFFMFTAVLKPDYGIVNLLAVNLKINKTAFG